MSQRYEIECTNKTSDSGSFCCFQRDPGIHDPNIYSLAWFEQRVGPQSNVRFPWELDYSFVCGKTGQLRPGVIFEASQVQQADLTDRNQITLEYQGRFQFERQDKGRQSGTLSITESPAIPRGEGAVGIGMSGVATFITQANPAMSLNFSPRPEYWVAFGDFRRGQVLDVRAINNPVRVEFPAGVFKMYATINQDGTWSISRNS